MKKPIDIEKLLQWALRDELPKGRPVSADVGYVIGRRHSRRPFSVAQAGVLPQVDSFGFVPGSPHEDAEVVASAIERIDAVARFDSRLQVTPLFGDLASIAGDAYAALMRATFNPQALIVSHGIMGTRPRWQSAAPRPYQMKYEFRDKAGSLRTRGVVYGTDDSGDVVMLAPNRGRAAMTRGLYDLAMAPRSPLLWDNPSVLQIGHARAEYVAWHSALVALSAGLTGRLAEFEPTPPLAAATPWIVDDEPQPRVLSGRVARVDGTLPLQPRRPPAARPIESRIEMQMRADRAARSRDRRRPAASAV